MASNPHTSSSFPASPEAPSFPPHRNSIAAGSTSSHQTVQVDKEQLAQTLDKIHTSASQSDALTTFTDFTDPSVVPEPEPKNAGDLVQQGISGLYNRFKESLGAVGSSAKSNPAQALGSANSLTVGHDTDDILDIPLHHSPNPKPTSPGSASTLPRLETLSPAAMQPKAADQTVSPSAAAAAASTESSQTSLGLTILSGRQSSTLR